MKKAMFGGSILLGGAIALTGCMGGTAASTADLGSVPASVDGRTDMFLDHNHLITAAELGDSTTALPVDVSVSDWTLTARVHGAPEIAAQWHALDVVSAEDVVNATPIDGELNPGTTGTIVLPRGQQLRFGQGGGSGTIPGGTLDPGDHLIIDWSETTGSIPDSVDVELFEGLNNAHPGCA